MDRLFSKSHGGRKPDTWHVFSVLKQQQGRFFSYGYGFSRVIELAGSNNHALIPDYFSTAAEHALKLGKTNECKELFNIIIAKWPEHTATDYG